MSIWQAFKPVAFYDVAYCLTHILNREQEKQKTVGKKNVTIESIDRFNSRFILKNIYIYIPIYIGYYR